MKSTIPKPQTIIHWLISLNCISLVFAIMLITFGSIAIPYLNSTPQSQVNASEFHDRFATRIGTTYDEVLHKDLSELIKSSNRTIKFSFKIIHRFKHISTVIGICGLLIAIANMAATLRIANRMKDHLALDTPPHTGNE